MRLLSLVEPLLVKQVTGNADIEIAGLQTDSRRVQPGDLFICLPGFTHDGHQFIEEAARKGAVAFLTEKVTAVPSNVPVILVPDARRALAILAQNWFGTDRYPTKLIGVTGTNGKTTTLHMIHHILTGHHKNTGMIGTLGFRMGELYEQTRNTTPDVLELQRYLKTIGERQGQYALIEVSSHGLEMGRLRGCDFQTVVFTNLSHDHLDYHQTMDQYKRTKELLFSQLGNGIHSFRKTAVLNADDKASEDFAKHTSAQILRYGLSGHADITAGRVRTTPDFTSFTVHTPWGDESVILKLNGLYNVYNALAAISVCLVEGISLREISDHLLTFEGVPGRLEQIDAGQSFRVVVDYAHNPAGLASVLQTLKETTKGKLICVFGSRGGRDRKKRPVMAQIAADHAERVIFTSDNPGSENPESIISDMTAGLYSKQTERCLVIPDRKQAIFEAVRMAGEDDCVVITGRGHEKDLQLRDEMVPLSDPDLVGQAFQIIHQSTDSRP